MPGWTALSFLREHILMITFYLLRILFKFSTFLTLFKVKFVVLFLFFGFFLHYIFNVSGDNPLYYVSPAWHV